MSQWRSVFSLGLLITVAHTAYGDIAPGRDPLPKPPMLAPVRIHNGSLKHLGSNVAAKIVIPGSLLPDLQEPTYGQQASQKDSAARTIVAGLLTTAAAISLMVVKTNSSLWKKTVAGVIAIAVLTGGVVLVNSFTSPAAPSAADLSTSQRLIVIEIRKDGHEVTLVLENGYNGSE
ncbi:MAG: hypothetical protein KDA81_11580 [Planctomycetaceae bacterium]|nr:hypothetical protein [Planctomycetaceae bacterium]MCA9084692.1 hypothetical protein [Planctomycetaceae bacterium]